MATPNEDKEGSEAFMQTFIDLPLWDKAHWRATVFMGRQDGSEHPFLGIGFEDIEPGIKIFEQWQERLGTFDEHDELRVSIIEGPIPGEEPGYTVFISSNPLNTMARMTNKDFNPTHVVVLSRINRMNPAPNSPHLPMFKRLYAAHKRFALIPVHVNLKTGQARPFVEHRIMKETVNFIPSTKIGPNDPECFALRNV